jgi:hypothetical protein
MKHWLFLALLTWIALSPAAARAEPSAADRTTARRLAVEGQIALKREDFDTAVDRFERANELVPAPSFLVRLARAKAGQGRLVEAYELYNKIIREGVTPDQPQAFQRALDDAKQEVKAIDPRLAWVSVTVVGARPDQVEVSLNGVEIPGAALGAQRPVDPGTVRAVAKADGFRSAEAEVELAEGEHGPAIELRLIELPKPPPTAEKDPSRLMVDAEPPFISQTALGFTALGVGGAVLIAGSITGILALQKDGEIDDMLDCMSLANRPDLQATGACYVDTSDDPGLPNRARALKADRNQMARLTNIGLIGGGALAATGLILLLTAPDEPGDPTGASVRPYVGIGSIGAVGRF